MKKLLCLVMVFSAMFAATAFAEVGLQIGVPYMLTAKGNVDSGASGSSFALMFGMDQSVEVGIMHEQYDITFAGVGAPAPAYLTSLRINKYLQGPFYFGIGLGNANINNATTAPVADVLVGGKFLISKEKITTFLTTDLGYRMMKSKALVNGERDFSGIRVGVAAGIAF